MEDRKGFFKENSAQVSAELIIVIAALIAVAVMFVTQLGDTAKKGNKVLADKTVDVLDDIKNMGKT